MEHLNWTGLIIKGMAVEAEHICASEVVFATSLHFSTLNEKRELIVSFLTIILRILFFKFTEEEYLRLFPSYPDPNHYFSAPKHKTVLFK